MNNMLLKGTGRCWRARWVVLLPIFLSMTSLAAGDVIWKTYRNDSGADATDFSLATADGKAGIADAAVYQPAGPGMEKTARISKDPPAGTFPAASVDLDLLIKVGDGKKATVKIGFPKGMEPTLDDKKTGFTNAKGDVVSSTLLTMAPQIMNLGGGKFEVVLTNVNGSAVNVTSVNITYDDPGNPNLLDDYTQGGMVLKITQPTNPIFPGEMLDYFFSADPGLTVSVSDVVALTSNPGDTFFDLAAAEPVPEPSAIALLAIGSVIIIGYRGRKKGKKGDQVRLESLTYAKSS